MSCFIHFRYRRLESSGHSQHLLELFQLLSSSAESVLDSVRIFLLSGDFERLSYLDLKLFCNRVIELISYKWPQKTESLPVNNIDEPFVFAGASFIAFKKVRYSLTASWRKIKFLSSAIHHWSRQDIKAHLVSPWTWAPIFGTCETWLMIMILGPMAYPQLYLPATLGHGNT